MSWWDGDEKMEALKEESRITREAYFQKEVERNREEAGYSKGYIAGFKNGYKKGVSYGQLTIFESIERLYVDQPMPEIIRAYMSIRRALEDKEKKDDCD